MKQKTQEKSSAILSGLFHTAAAGIVVGTAGLIGRFQVQETSLQPRGLLVDRSGWVSLTEIKKILKSELDKSHQGLKISMSFAGLCFVN